MQLSSIDSWFVGSGNDRTNISLDIPINLVNGKNTIDLLSVTVGLAVGSIHQHITAQKCLLGMINSTSLA